jgi:hypothetical protein
VSADHLLRHYGAVLSADGYPHEWHVQVPYRTDIEGQYEMLPRIPDLIREMRGHRCERCGHPYRKGDPGISERGEWSPCDGDCMHGLPFRYRGGEDEEWKVATTSWAIAGEGIFDTGPGGQLMKRYDVEAQWRILTVHHLDSDKANCRWWNLVALCQRCHLRMQRAVVMDREYYFEHSEWFKPYAAGFYAFKYEGEELSRPETMNRLEYLLGYEHRFTQEAIF